MTNVIIAESDFTTSIPNIEHKLIDHTHYVNYVQQVFFEHIL